MSVIDRLSLFDPRSSADQVLSRCGRPDVACWRPARNLRLALFLERHKGETELPEGQARARFAFRTWAPRSFAFRPTFVCEGGTLTTDAETDTEGGAVHVPAGRSDGRRYSEGLTMSRAPHVMVGTDGARVRAVVEFSNDVARDDLRELSVELPKEGDVKPRCPCS